MNHLRYVVINVIETLLRVAPIPCRTGLRTIGNPDRESPVFLTGNYHLTVERVKRALRGIDCYLLVANSRGHNVWCGATGGHMTHHEVISVLKTSGIESLTDRRKVILPQLAATGIEAKLITQRTGWHVVWGPVYAKDIPNFVRNGYKKTQEMRTVQFELPQRSEMAVMWAFPFSIIASLILLPFAPDLILSMNAAIWGFSLSLFGLFPLYVRFLGSRRTRLRASSYTVIFDLGRVPFTLWILFMASLALWGVASGSAGWDLFARWGFISFAVLLLISIDLNGSTPTLKSGLHEESRLKISLDRDACHCAGFCEEVCPVDCFDIDTAELKAVLARGDSCVQCGACIVQCPFDALEFEGADGMRVTPQTVRTFRLNLMGKRLVGVDGHRSDDA